MSPILKAQMTKPWQRDYVIPSIGSAAFGLDSLCRTKKKKKTKKKRKEKKKKKEEKNPPQKPRGQIPRHQISWHHG